MRTLNRYILREIAAPLLLAMAVISFLGVGNELRERMRYLPLNVFEIADFVRLTVYFLPSLVSMVVPIAYMMGILMAFGRLAHDGEIIAMKAAGVPLKRVVAPVIAVGALLSVVCFYLQDRVQPLGLAKAQRLITIEMPLRITLDMLPTGQMHHFGDWQVYIGSKDAATGALHNIDILDGKGTMYFAESAELIKGEPSSRIVLKNANIVFPERDRAFVMNRTTETELLVPETSTSRNIGNDRKGMPLRALLAREKSESAKLAQTQLEDDKKSLRSTRSEISDRLSYPLACLAVTLAAAPLGARARRAGRSYTFAVGSGVFLVYYVLKFVLEPKTLHSLGDVIVRGLAPDIVLLAAGGVLLWRVDRI
ncbi:MAG: LptF/LptG family permease [Candidatus Hydrogenedentes bacterium]|nr:LptF/LptG family permease [Candidatus Hydrogenedentota bacterium]